MASSAWGIDVGNRALKAVKLVREGEQLRVEDFEVIEHEQILSVAGDNKESLVQSALANFVQRHDTRGSAVGVSVSGQQSFARFIKLPPVEPRKIPEIVRFEAIQQIPFPLDDVEWSYQLFRDPESPDVEVGIFAMKKDLVNRQIGYFTNLGLDVQVVQMHPLAVYNAMYHDEQTGQTTMFMDAGAENTDLIIADGQTVWLRTLPIGGNNFTEMLAKSFKLSFQKAEELKRNAATSKYAKQIFQAMRPVFADLVAEIQRSIGFYASVHRDARIGRIVAQGSTFQLPGLQKYLQQNLQLPVEKLDSFRALPPADAKMAANLQENIISLAGAYGLAIQTMGDGQIVSSLLPEQIRRAKMWREKTKWFAAAAAAIVLGTAGAGVRYYTERLQYDNNRQMREQTKSVIDRANRLANDWRSIQDGGEADRTRLLNIRSLQDYRDMWGQLLSDVFSSVPPVDMLQLKAIPRRDRQLVLIDSIGSKYFPDLSEPLKATFSELSSRFVGKDVQPSLLQEIQAPDFGGGMDGGGWGGPNGFPGGNPFPGAFRIGSAEDPNIGGTFGGGNGSPDTPVADVAAGAKHGFLLTIRGTTPNKDTTGFLDQTMIKNLLSLTEQAMAGKKPYYVARVELVGSQSRVVPNGQGDADLGPTLGQGDNRATLDRSKDRYFPEESIEGDTEFTVLVIVVLDPEKKAEIK